MDHTSGPVQPVGPHSSVLRSPGLSSDSLGLVATWSFHSVHVYHASGPFDLGPDPSFFQAWVTHPAPWAVRCIIPEVTRFISPSVNGSSTGCPSGLTSMSPLCTSLDNSRESRGRASWMCKVRVHTVPPT